MERVVRAALARGVAVGAHPSYPDREGFGRRTMALSLGGGRRRRGRAGGGASSTSRSAAARGSRTSSRTAPSTTRRRRTTPSRGRSPTASRASPRASSSSVSPDRRCSRGSPRKGFPFAGGGVRRPRLRARRNPDAARAARRPEGDGRRGGRAGGLDRRPAARSSRRAAKSSPSPRGPSASTPTHPARSTSRGPSPRGSGKRGSRSVLCETGLDDGEHGSTGGTGEIQLHRHVASAGGRVRGGTSHGRRCARPTRFRVRCGRAGGPRELLASLVKHARGPDPRPVLANSSGSPCVLEGGSRDAPPLPRPASFRQIEGEPPSAAARPYARELKT